MSSEDRAPSDRVADGPSCLVVRAGGEQFGLPTESVVRVLRNHAVYPVPGSAAPMVGLAQLGGEPVAVVDLRQLIEGGAGTEDHRLILLVDTGPEGSRQILGLAIDEALETILMPAAADGGVETGVIIGESVYQDRRVRVIDPGRLIGGRELSGMTASP